MNKAQIQRLDPTTAEGYLLDIEDTILTPAQLLYTDRLFSSRGEKAETSSARSQNSREGAGLSGQDNQRGEFSSISSYLSGGQYNPFLDQGRPLGDNFTMLRELLQDFGAHTWQP